MRNNFRIGAGNSVLVFNNGFDIGELNRHKYLGPYKCSDMYFDREWKERRRKIFEVGKFKLQNLTVLLENIHGIKCQIEFAFSYKIFHINENAQI